MSRRKKRETRGLKGEGRNDSDIDESVDDEDESGFMGKVEELKDKFKLGSHHKMERFAIMSAAATILVFSFVGISYSKHRNNIAIVETTRALFQKNMTFSLSNQKVQLENIFSSPENNDVIVLFKIENPEEMSANAENYELFIKKQSGKMKAEYKPEKVSMSIFSNTGYGIFRFQNQDRPFENGVLDITVRANSKFAEGTNELGSDEGAKDDSFNDFDQAMFSVNLGVTGINKVEGLKTHEKNPVKIYTALIAKEKDDEIRKELFVEVDALDALFKREEEYISRITRAGFEKPQQPWFMRGDSIDEIEAEFDDDDGEEGTQKRTSYKILNAVNNLEKAHDFDYWHKNIDDGYITQIASGLDDFSEYMENYDKIGSDEHSSRIDEIELINKIEEMRVELRDTRETLSDMQEDRMKEDILELEEKLAVRVELRKEDAERLRAEGNKIEELVGRDGEILILKDVGTTVSSNIHISVKESVDSLIQIRQEYLTSKSKIQVSLANKLLDLDIDVQAQKENYTLNEDAEKIHYY